MIFLYFLWINFMLVLITSGYSTTAIVLYIISSIFLTIKGLIVIWSTFVAKTHKELYNSMHSVYNGKPLISMSNIICSNVIHLVLITIFLNSYAAIALVTIGVIVRIKESYFMEKLFNG